MSKDNPTAKASGPAQEQHAKKGQYHHKWQRHGQNDGKKKDPEAIPVLKYGLSNNFTMRPKGIWSTWQTDQAE